MKSRIVVAGLIKKDDKYLFGKQEGGFSPDKLVILGGGMDLGESPEEALRREFLEEANIQLKNIKPAHFDHYIGPYKGEPYHLTFLQFTADYESGEPKPGDDIVELLWLTKEQIQQYPQNEATLKFLKFIGLIN